MSNPDTIHRLVQRFLHSDDDSVDDGLKKDWQSVVVDFDGNIDKATTAVECAYRDSVAAEFFKDKGIDNTEEAIKQAYEDDPDLWEEAFEYVEENWGSVEHEWWNLFRQTDQELPGWLLV